MKRVFAICLFAGFIATAMTGCGTPEPSNMLEGADQTALEQYEAAIAAEEAALNADPDDGSGGTSE